MDIFSVEKRREIMGHIRGKNTKPELIVRSILHRAGYRFRLHRKNLPGKPDIVLPKYKLVVFVNGCYWHRHTDCKRGSSMPSTNVKFWQEKFRRTQQRDKNNEDNLCALGWQVVTIWQCELTKPEAILNKITAALLPTTTD